MAENKATFIVHGLTAADECQQIEDELLEMNGVMGTDIDHDSGAATVRYDADLLAEERIKITVREMGYEVE